MLISSEPHTLPLAVLQKRHCEKTRRTEQNGRDKRIEVPYHHNFIVTSASKPPARSGPTNAQHGTRVHGQGT
jgi:hypothetical protein